MSNVRDPIQPMQGINGLRRVTKDELIGANTKDHTIKLKKYLQLRKKRRLVKKNMDEKPKTKSKNKKKESKKDIARKRERRKATKALNIFYNDKARLLFCSVPKVASTNWKRIIHTIMGSLSSPDQETEKEKRIHKGIPHLTSLSRKESAFRQRNYFSFLFTRHPFERVFSAYRDKLKTGMDVYLYRKYNTIILQSVRNESFVEGTSKPSTLSEFVQFLITQHKKGLSYKMNPHWRPVVLLCNVCNMKYTVVGKMETIRSDSDLITDYLSTQTGLQLSLPTMRRYKNKSSSMAVDTFKEVPRKLVEQLYAVYKNDFKAFGYTTNGFL